MRDLRDRGHDVVRLSEVGDPEADDPEVLALATRMGRILLTEDLDFCNIREYPPSQSCGIITIRIRRSPIPDVLAHVRRLVQSQTQDNLSGRLAVVGGKGYRLRA